MEGFTLLHWAAEKGLADFCRRMGFACPATSALRHDYIRRVICSLRYFVDLNADVNAVDSRGLLGSKVDHGRCMGAEQRKFSPACKFKRLCEHQADSTAVCYGLQEHGSRTCAAGAYGPVAHAAQLESLKQLLPAYPTHTTSDKPRPKSRTGSQDPGAVEEVLLAGTSSMLKSSGQRSFAGAVRAA